MLDGLLAAELPLSIASTERQQAVAARGVAEALRRSVEARERLQLGSLRAMQRWEADGRPLGTRDELPIFAGYAPLPLPPQLAALARCLAPRPS